MADVDGVANWKANLSAKTQSSLTSGPCVGPGTDWALAPASHTDLNAHEGHRCAEVTERCVEARLRL